MEKVFFHVAVFKKDEKLLCEDDKCNFDGLLKNLQKNLHKNYV